jgi:MFS family permease
MIFFVLVIAAFCVETSMSLPMGSLPLVLGQEGVSHHHIALVMGAGMFAMVIAAIPLGALVDRIGRVVTMRISSIGALLALAVLGFAHGSIMAALMMSVRSLALVAYMTAQSAYVSGLVRKERQVSAVATMGIVGSLAFATAPAIAVWLWQHGCAREQYLWGTLIIGLGGLMTWFLPKEEPLSETADGQRVFFIKAWLPALIFGIFGSLQSGVNVSLAVLAFHERGIANGAALFSAAAITTVVFRYPCGRLVESIPPRWVACLIAIIQGAGCILAADAQTLPAVITAGIIFGIAWAAFIPTVLAFLFEESTDSQRGAVMGVFNFALGSGMTLGASLASYTSAHGGGYEEASLLCAMATSLALPFLLFKINIKKGLPLKKQALPVPEIQG